MATRLISLELISEPPGLILPASAARGGNLSIRTIIPQEKYHQSTTEPRKPSFSGPPQHHPHTWNARFASQPGNRSLISLAELSL